MFFIKSKKLWRYKFGNHVPRYGQITPQWCHHVHISADRFIKI